MSHYPYGYGFQGQQPPQQQYPPYQPYAAYPAPGYGAQPPPQQQPPAATADYYTATQSAYDYNANNIPGLGTPLTAPQFPVPFGGQWEQGGYGTSATPGPYPTYNSSTFVPIPPAQPSQANPQARAPVPQEAQPNPQYRPDSSRQQSKPRPREEQLKEQSSHPLKDVDSQDEGEISDGEFDDLYEDVYDQPSVAPKAKAASPTSSEDQAASSTDQGANFYDTEMEEVSASNDRPQTATAKAPSDQDLREQEPMRSERDRSGSYSPYLSPREIEQDDPPPQIVADDAQGRSQGQFNSTNNDAIAVSSTSSSANVQEQVIDANQSKETDVTTNQSVSGSIASQSFRSLPEAQNEAKKAILRLLPHGVKYQTYLDEGFDEKVIKDLFIQLNLAPATADSVPSVKPLEVQENKTQDQAAPPSQASQADDMAKKQEERKDKIARLLAEKKAKAAAEATTAPKAPSTAISTGASTPSTPANKPTTQAQKTLLLQQKMEALRKAREARTQQASQKPNPPKAPETNLPKKPSPMPPAPGSAVAAAAQTSAGLNSTVQIDVPPGTLPTPSDHPRNIASRPNSGIQSPALSGLSNKPINQRKRPVAADFVDYPTQAIKRPLLPSRQASSLVISVSDDEEEEDDDDVDMEVDSTTEDSPVPTQQTINLPRRGPSVRDYPPLTNAGPPRHLSSPAPGTPGGKTATVDLKAMEKAIADYKRKIQEAEARAKVKPSTGSSTPQSPSAGGLTPTEQATKSLVHRVVSSSDVDDKNGPSAQLLQEAEAAKTPKPTVLSPVVGHSRVERRVRTTSAQSPRLSTKLQDKIAELKRMEEERRRLQAEIDAELAQQQMEEEDMDELGSDSAGEIASETTPIDKGASSSNEPGQDESQRAALDGPSHSLPMDLESVSRKSDSEVEPSTTTSLAPALAAVDEAVYIPPATQEPTHADDAASPLASQPAEVLAAIATVTPAEKQVLAAAEGSTSDDYEPPDAAGHDRGTIDSPPFSPAPAENVTNADAPVGESQEITPPTTMPTQISTATIPNDDPTIEARADFFAHPSSRTADVLREVYIVSSLH
ncbi:hypothetical protein N8I77_010284 [Diaporthe amygdali]|uniref:Uncharacterized protein n=1 Tax=Phomopsis amygdali TaxID=1214568 RepID=A0AAD9VYZ3_PHOAM|nr:hypothetical protein N8I77_010284 [Diaporthe amygdali]